MEWQKAKKFVVVLLVILNACLAVLNYQQNRESAMTASQEKAIFEVLSKNGITMYTDLITDTEPMSRLECMVPTYTKEDLERAFFDGEKTTVVPSQTTTVYRTSSSELTVEGAHGTLTFPQVEKGKGELSRGDALKMAEEYMDGKEKIFGEFVSYDLLETEEGYCVVFYEKYDDTIVFSNYFRVFVSQAGIYQVQFVYCPVVGYNGEKKDIFYADEALLTFMRELRKNQPEGAVTVNRMELGYDLSDKESQTKEGMLYAVPCYRIYLMEQAEPYIINAYTCKLINEE
ncbi:two-component system regulatory protein YycI [Anaerotignum lactatifermentans]|uniref:two-component system regulatory protein YycI n=1 Tax=Anaerotignum lactatifermentans TaxID=160404 RepID=UPI00307C3452